MGATSSVVKNRYNAKTYDRIEIVVPKGAKAFIKSEAEAAGESVNALITRALLDRLGLDSWPESAESIAQKEKAP